MRVVTTKSESSFNAASRRSSTETVTRTILVRSRLTTALLAHVADAVGRSAHLNHILGKCFSQFGLFMFRSGHLIFTEIVWFHFFYIKFKAVESAVPTGAPNYWLKRVVPPVEFGAMHAILLQLALIPLTMARHSLSLLSSDPAICKVVPFEHMTEFHIFIGYTFCAVMCLSVVLFFVFFGKVCTDFKLGRDPVNLCEKFSSEIMLTGYGIFAVTLIVLLSSYFRNKLRFEVFYALHHSVFIIYLLAILHTLDGEMRNNGRSRSQTFRWVFVSLLIYFADRAWAYCSAHRGLLVRSIAVAYDASVVVLTLKRPPSFSFRSGQHAYLQIPVLDKTWHPFSISSEPSDLELKFLIEVKEHGSWTRRLARFKNVVGLKVNVMGGFGCSVSDLKMYSEVLAVGTGTGIVPMISLMLERKHRLLLLNKSVWLDGDDRMPLWPRSQRVNEAALAYVQLLWRMRQIGLHGHLSVYLRAVMRKAQKQVLHTLMDVLTTVLVLLELWLVGSTISWSEFAGGTPASSLMGQILRCTTAGAVTLYSLLCIYHLANPDRFRRSFYSILNCGLIGSMVYSCAASWDRDYSWEKEALGLQARRIFFGLWRIQWLWSWTPAMRHTKKIHGSLSRELLQEKTFRLLWSCRSADLLLGTVPEINSMLEELQTGLQTTASGSRKFLGIELYCTDTDVDKVTALQQKLQGTLLQDFVHFRRPDLRESILQIMRKQLAEALNTGVSPHQRAHSLVTFCGSPAVSTICQQHVAEANLMADALAFHDHKLVFRQEFYGHVGGETTARDKKRFGSVSSTGSSNFTWQSSCSSKSPKVTGETSCSSKPHGHGNEKLHGHPVTKETSWETVPSNPIEELVQRAEPQVRQLASL